MFSSVRKLKAFSAAHLDAELNEFLTTVLAGLDENKELSKDEFRNLLVRKSERSPWDNLVLMDQVKKW